MAQSSRLAVALTALVLLLSACAGESDSVSSPEPVDDTANPEAATDATDNETSELTASAPGVTAETIKFGILVVDVEALSGVGINLAPGNRQAQWQAAIDTANEQGGVNGRMIEPVFRVVSPIGSTESDEACIALTEDDPVFIVTGILIRDQPLCYSAVHDTAVITLQSATEEVVAKSSAPLRSYRATVEDQNRRFVTAATAAGALELGQKVGVIEAQNDDEGFNSTVAALRDAGYDVVEGPIDTPPGDEVALRSAQSLILARFEAEDVDVVVNQGLGLFPLSEAIKGGYDFPFVLTQYVDPARFVEEGLGNSNSDGVFTLADSLIGTSGQPELANEPGVAACIAAYEATEGSEEVVTDPTSKSTNLKGVIESCNVISLFVRAATEAGPDLNNDTLARAFDALGELELVGLPFASLSPGKTSISDTAVPVRFDAAAALWAPAGDIVNTEVNQ